MTVHVLYRSYGGENKKDRPDFYSKLMALASCVRAAETAGVPITFLNDGPIPADRLKLMRASGDVKTLVGSGMRASYLAALHWAAALPFPDSDIVWFSEDDYLYDPDAFVALQRLADAHPDASNYALYGETGTAEDVASGRSDYAGPAHWNPKRVSVGSDSWVQVDSTASTFGLRLGALRKDFDIFRLCMLPHRNQLRDHDTCLVYQGFEPYAWSDLFKSLVLMAPGTPVQRLRLAVFTPFFMATNLRAHRFPRNRRVLLAPQPNLATHLETRYMSEGREWARIASETMAWLAERDAVSAARD